MKRRQKTKVSMPEWETEFMCLRAALQERFIGQKEAVDQVASIMANQVIRGKQGSETVAPRVLLVGNTSSGKTYLVDQVVEILNAPKVTVNCGLLTPEAYKGVNLSSAVKTLIADGGLGGLERVQKSSVTILDEICKIQRRSAKDSWLEQLQFATLPILNGENLLVESEDGYEPSKSISTKNILVFGCGVFPGIPTSAWASPETSRRALLKYGYCEEWVSRWTHFITLSPLTLEQITELTKREIVKTQKLYQSGKFIPELSHQHIKSISREVQTSKFGFRTARSLIHSKLFETAMKRERDLGRSYK